MVRNLTHVTEWFWYALRRCISDSKKILLIISCKQLQGNGPLIMKWSARFSLLNLFDWQERLPCYWINDYPYQNNSDFLTKPRSVWRLESQMMKLRSSVSFSLAKNNLLGNQGLKGHCGLCTHAHACGLNCEPQKTSKK